MHLGERLELALGPLHLCLRVADVHLDDLRARDRAGVGHPHGDPHAGVGAGAGHLGRGVVVRERRVGQAVPERVGDVDLAGVVPAVAHEHALAVADVAELAGEVPERGGVLEPQGQGLGEPARRRDGAREHVGDGGAAGLAAQPAGEQRGGVVLPRGDRDRRAAGEHHDDARVHRGDGAQQRDLVGGQVEVVAVVALRLVRGGQAEEHEHGTRAPRRLDGLGDERVGGAVVGGALGQRVARRERQVGAGGPPQRGERVVEAGRVDLGGAGALVPRGAGELAHDDGAGERLGRQGQQGRTVDGVVPQQHRARRGGLAGERVVGVDVERAGRVQRREGAGDQVQHAARGGVDEGLVERAGTDRGDDLGIGAATGRRHLQVEPGGDPGDAVADGAPVGDDEALEAPLVAQHRGEQPVVLRGVDVVHLVVGAHDGPGLRLRDDALEGRQVDLAQRALVDIGRHAHPVGLLVVGGEVLERRADAEGLDALDQGRRELAGHDRVLGEVLEVATAQRRPLDVDARSEQDGDVVRAGLAPERRADPAQQVGVPARPERGRGGEAGGGHAVAEPEVVGGLVLLAQPVGAVGDHHRRDEGLAVALDRLRVPEVDAGEQRGLLLQRERREHALDVERVGGRRAGR